MYSSPASPQKYTEEYLNNLTITQIKVLADVYGYKITETRKADIIKEFLEQQEESV